MNTDRPTKIFISYRWSCTYNEAKILQRSIEASFENVHVFRDEEEAKPGDSLTKKITDALNETTLVLALLHEDWQNKPLKPQSNCMNILFKEDDWVCMELDYANKKGLKVIPVLCNGATLPPRNNEQEKNHALPQCLHFLSDDTLAKKMDKSNDSEIGILQFLKEELHLVEREKTEKLPAKSRLEGDGLELPDILPDKIKVPTPYLGLPYYEEKHARLFFGRSDDVCELWDKVDRKTEQLILLYGYSGVGKSSLLHAGFFPRVKMKGWAVLDERRKKDKSLDSLLDELLLKTLATGKTLIAIDQLEEALIEPFNGQEELPAFFEKVKTALENHPNLKLLLGFRKEFLSEIQEQVKKGISANTTDYFLKPLSDAGVREAIALDEQIKKHYEYAMAEDLEDAIADGIIERGVQAHSGEVSSKAPWLQLLLLNLWQEAEKKHAGLGTLELTKQHLDTVRRDTFPLLVENQLSKLETQSPPHGNLYKNGLTLDLLNYLTTAGGTAAIRADETLLQRYNRNATELTDHLRLLENLQLVTRIEGRSDKPFTRLAHDALAPIIRQRFEQSDSPVQRGHRIFASKKSFDRNGAPMISPIQDKDDIALLRQAKEFMCKWSDAEQAAFVEGEKALARAETKLRDITAFVFDSFAKVGTDLILSLNHAQALEKMEVAVEVDIDFETKKQKLRQPLEELLFFFAEGGKKPELARAAAELLLKLEPSETLAAGLQKCLKEGWDKRSQFSALLQDLPFFPTLQTRYYPEMIDLPAGTFDMGSPESEPGHQSDEALHEVKLSAPYRLASTPLTFYQYALFCEANGKSIASMTPSWGRFGDHPLVNINWYDAIEFCNWLSRQLPGLSVCYDILKEKNSDKNNKVANDYLKWKVEVDKNANGFRLPTEAEWEFAARGGSASNPTLFAGSDKLDEVGWFWENSGDKTLSGNWDNARVLDNNCRTHAVKGKKPNGIGLYDMSGNVYEWCWDWYDEDFYEACKKKGTVENTTGPESSSSGRVLRGGSWGVIDVICRVACRIRDGPSLRCDVTGCRLAQDYTHPLPF